MNLTFLYRKVDAAPLAAFRILIGILLACEGFGAIITGWVRDNYVDVPFTFNFIGFDFLQVMVGPQAYALYALLGLAGLAFAAGYRYKLSAAIYLAVWTAVYLGQKTSYNNHYYLLWILCMIFVCVPMNTAYSLDAKQGRVAKSDTVPYWYIWIFKALLAVVYFYAAVAKLYPDWLSGRAVTTFFSAKCDLALVGHLCKEEWFILLISYGGIAFDFLVIPALWYRRTRVLAFIVSIFFHLFNSYAFQIGIFPYMMLITSVLFFDPARIRYLFFRSRLSEAPSGYAMPSGKRKTIFQTTLILFFAVMILLPLRHFFYPGTPHWSEEAHRLSWHMMLRSKYGSVVFKVIDADTGQDITIAPETRLPEKMARGLATRPDLIWQYAQILEKEYREKGFATPQVYVRSNVSLNGRPYRPLIDPKTDLAAEPWSHIKPHAWILPHPDLWNGD